MRRSKDDSGGAGTSEDVRTTSGGREGVVSMGEVVELRDLLRAASEELEGERRRLAGERSGLRGGRLSVDRSEILAHCDRMAASGTASAKCAYLGGVSERDGMRAALEVLCAYSAQHGDGVLVALVFVRDVLVREGGEWVDRFDEINSLVQSVLRGC